MCEVVFMPFGRKEKPEVMEFLDKYNAKFPKLGYENLANSPLGLVKFADYLCSLRDVEDFAMANKFTAVLTIRNEKFRYLAVGWDRKCDFRALMPIEMPPGVSPQKLANEMTRENMPDDRVGKDRELSEYLKSYGIQHGVKLSILKGDRFLPPGEWNDIRWRDIDPSALDALNKVETFLEHFAKYSDLVGEGFDTAVNTISSEKTLPPDRIMFRKCRKCGFEMPLEATFCPKCGTAVTKKMSDKEIGSLIFKRWGKKYDEALEAAYIAFTDDFEGGVLHKDLLIRYMVPDLMPKEAKYQDEAVERFLKKHEGDSNLKEAVSYYKLGLISENEKKLEDAMKEYDKALKKFPDFAPALLRSATVQSAIGKFKEALKNFLRAGDADPKFCLAFFHQGILFKKRKKRDDALESYRKCVALDPDNAAAHNNMGLIHIDNRDFENAEREFSEVLRIFPNHPTGLRNLELARKGRGRGWRRIL
jgi:Tfp pilus assembly protein PilF